MVNVVETDKENCTFHGRKWQAGYQQLLNFIRANRDVFPAGYPAAFTGYSCTCGQRKSRPRTDIIDAAAENLGREAFVAFIARYKGVFTVVSALVPYFEHLLSTWTPEGKNPGAVRLLCLLQAALIGQPPDLLQSLTSRGHQHKAGSGKHVVELQIDPRNMGLFVSKQGAFIKALEQEYACRILIPPKPKKSTPVSLAVFNAPNFKEEKKTFKLILDGKLDHPEELAEKLKIRAEEISKKRNLHSEKMKQHKEREKKKTCAVTRMEKRQRKKEYEEMKAEKQRLREEKQKQREEAQAQAPDQSPAQAPDQSPAQEQQEETKMEGTA